MPVAVRDYFATSGKKMTTLFFDIEIIPTPEALEAAGEVNDETIKKLSLSARTARVLCLGYALVSRR